MTLPSEPIKHTVDASAAIAIVGTIAGWLPVIAALLGAIWYALQIYGWVENRYKKTPAA